MRAAYTAYTPWHSKNNRNSWSMKLGLQNSKLWAIRRQEKEHSRKAQKLSAYTSQQAWTLHAQSNKMCASCGPLLHRWNALFLFYPLLDALNGVRRLNVDLNLLACQRFDLYCHASPSNQTCCRQATLSNKQLRKSNAQGRPSFMHCSKTV